MQTHAEYVVSTLLGEQLLPEASVHLPSRGTKWIAVFTGPIPGQQVSRSTGQTDRAAALKLAKEWESEARQQRQGSSRRPRPSSHRVKRQNASGEAPAEAGLTQREVALLLGMSERAVRNIEKRALAKLRAHPDLRGLFDEILGLEGLHESRSQADGDLVYFELTPGEARAILSLGCSPEERLLMVRLMREGGDVHCRNSGPKSSGGKPG